METSINETLAKGLATKIIREFHAHKIEYLGIDHYPRRKKLREAIKFFDKDPIHVVMAQMKPETSKWELLYGGWSPIFRSNFSLEQTDKNADYDKLGFDMDLDIPSGIYHRCIFFSLSKHGLERLILRKRPIIKHYVNASRYLNMIIVPIIQQCLAFISDPTRKSNKLVARVDGFVFLVEMSIGLNRYMKPTMSFHTITVMPENYEGAQKMMAENHSYELKPIIYYWKFINDFVVGDAGVKLFLAN
ncbi:hypothetical protein CF504_RS17825 [Vibrio parahaemolyticus]|uniref:hypothetical protein n=1 Tax=Vibrio parahaemolyticus TaxID=670 RepID=UPI000472B9E4|nr:hypothetical protein [Vibrio parahaemolyticus]EJG1483195.1 hypothetical protein [Vibrio parahaemolyticus]EJG1606211.1 hypothetical protein [Vibrio parahaemolyticus]